MLNRVAYVYIYWLEFQSHPGLEKVNRANSEARGLSVQQLSLLLYLTEINNLLLISVSLLVGPNQCRLSVLCNSLVPEPFLNNNELAVVDSFVEFGVTSTAGLILLACL